MSYLSFPLCVKKEYDSNDLGSVKAVALLHEFVLQTYFFLLSKSIPFRQQADNVVFLH